METSKEVLNSVSDHYQIMCNTLDNFVDTVRFAGKVIRREMQMQSDAWQDSSEADVWAAYADRFETYSAELPDIDAFTRSKDHA